MTAPDLARLRALAEAAEPTADSDSLTPADQRYNAAVAAQGAAARELAHERQPGSTASWVNSHGFFAHGPDGVCRQIGTAEEAAPFAALTTAARAGGA